jgi:hypothetical protein
MALTWLWFGLWVFIYVMWILSDGWSEVQALLNERTLPERLFYAILIGGPPSLLWTAYIVGYWILRGEWLVKPKHFIGVAGAITILGVVLALSIGVH